MDYHSFTFYTFLSPQMASPMALPHTVLSFGSQQRTGWGPHSPKLHMYRAMWWDLLPQSLGTVCTSAFRLWAETPMEPTPGWNGRQMMNDLRNRA